MDSPQNQTIYTFCNNWIRLKALLSNKKLWIGLLIGQLLAICNGCTGIFSGLLQKENINMPTTQTFFVYATICLLYTTYIFFVNNTSHILEILKNRSWKYFLISILDVEANYIVVKAYHYTSVTSVQILDCFTIPIVLILTKFIFKIAYKLNHFAGVIICLLGMGALIGADVIMERNTAIGHQKLIGDILVLAGAALYAFSNVAQEYLVKKYNQIEFLGMLGFFASFINGIQLCIFESHEISQFKFCFNTIFPLIGFIIAMVILYSLMPIALKTLGATSVNLNLLTADFYALMAGLFIFKNQFHILYFFGFFMVIFGVIIYSLNDVNEVHVSQDNSNGNNLENTEILQASNTFNTN